MDYKSEMTFGANRKFSLTLQLYAGLSELPLHSTPGL